MEAERIGVCIIVLDDDNKQVLLGKRLNSYKAGAYGLPGGRVESAESLEEGGKRELLEETSLKGKTLQYIGVVRDLQEGYTFIHFVYLCKQWDGIVTNVEPAKCEGWHWAPLHELPENIVPAHKAALDMYLNHGTTMRELIAAD